MAQAARNIRPSSQVPANDNASSLEKASLRLIQGEGTKQTKENRNQPTLHPVSDMRLARDLQESQARDRRDGRMSDATVSDDTLTTESEQEGESVLELEPRSYAKREDTPEEQEMHRQRKQAVTAARFLYPEEKMEAGVKAAEARGEGRGARGIRIRTSGVGEAAERQVDDRYAGGLFAEQQKDAARMARMMAGEGTMEDMLVASERAQDNMRFAQLVMKLAGLGNIATVLWVVIVLNIETWNILLFRKRLPPVMNRALNLLGLNINVDPNHVWTSINLATVFLTIVVDIIFTFVVLAATLLILFVTYWIMRAMDVSCLWGLIC